MTLAGRNNPLFFLQTTCAEATCGRCVSVCKRGLFLSLSRSKLRSPATTTSKAASAKCFSVPRRRPQERRKEEGKKERKSSRPSTYVERERARALSQKEWFSLSLSFPTSNRLSCPCVCVCVCARGWRRTIDIRAKERGCFLAFSWVRGAKEKTLFWSERQKSAQPWVRCRWAIYGKILVPPL